MARYSIGEVWRNAELALAAYLHPDDAFVPALDDLAATEQQLERLSGADGTIELLAIGEPSGVVDLDVYSGLRDCAGADFDVPILQAANGRCAFSSHLGRRGRLGG